MLPAPCWLKPALPPVPDILTDPLVVNVPAPKSTPWPAVDTPVTLSAPAPVFLNVALVKETPADVLDVPTIAADPLVKFRLEAAANETPEPVVSLPLTVKSPADERLLSKTPAPEDAFPISTKLPLLLVFVRLSAVAPLVVAVPFSVMVDPAAAVIVLSLTTSAVPPVVAPVLATTVKLPEFTVCVVPAPNSTPPNVLLDNVVPAKVRLPLFTVTLPALRPDPPTPDSVTVPLVVKFVKAAPHPDAAVPF